MAGDGTDGTDGTAPGQAGGERRRALREERGAGRRSAHAAPRQASTTAFAPAAPLTPSPTPVAPATPVMPQPAVAQHAAPGALGPALPAAQLPSRRDRAALRRPSALDEPAVLAGDTMAWKSFPALSDTPTRSALATSAAPLTRALARSITEHLDAPSEPMTPAFVPRGRSAPAISGPLDVVAPAPAREPSWTTGPVPTRRSRREAELPPPPPASEVAALLREQEVRRATTGSSSVVVPAAALLPTSSPTSSPTPAQGPVAGPGPVRTSPLAPADLAALRTAAATTTTPATPAAAGSAGATAAVTRVTGRPTTRTTARTPAGSAARTTGPATRHARTGATPAPRRWHQRRALGLPVGLLAAAAALVVAVGLGALSPQARQLPSTLLTAATGGSTPAAAPERTTEPAPQDTATPPAEAAQDEATADAAAPAAGGAAAGDTAAAEQAPAAGATSAPAAEPAASASAAPAALIPTGDVTYEGFGTAKNTYVELGTADSRETSTDLGSTFTKTMEGSAAWPGWYVAVNSQDGQGTVGCRIKDADGRVLVEREVQAQPETGKTLALCIIGTPPGVNG